MGRGWRRRSALRPASPGRRPALPALHCGGADRLADGTTPGVLSLSGGEPQPYDDDKAGRLQDIADFVADEWERAQALAALAKSLQERDRALERIERSEERLNLALSLSEMHVWELDYEHKVLIKAGAEANFFAVPQTYERSHARSFRHRASADLPAILAAWAAHREHGTPFNLEHRANRADGKEVWLRSVMKALPVGSRRPARIVGALKDITAAKQAERALLAAKEEADNANRAKSNFLATMSHELRTPLNAILGFAEMIEKQIVGPVPDRYVGYARDIHASGRHLLDLVNDVLDISKLEAGKVELHEPCSIRTPCWRRSPPRSAIWPGRRTSTSAGRSRHCPRCAPTGGSSSRSCSTCFPMR